MSYLLLLPALFSAAPSATVRGQYVEARTCDVFAGSCFSNADTGLTGKNAALAWFLRAAAQIPVERLSRGAKGAFDAVMPWTTEEMVPARLTGSRTRLKP